MLQRIHRLRSRHDIKRVFKSGKRQHSQNITLNFTANHQQTKRLAVVVSTKISKRAVVRNRLRRRINGLARLHWPNLAEGIDLVVVVKSDFTKVATADFAAEFKTALQRAGLI